MASGNVGSEARVLGARPGQQRGGFMCPACAEEAGSSGGSAVAWAANLMCSACAQIYRNPSCDDNAHTVAAAVATLRASMEAQRLEGERESRPVEDREAVMALERSVKWYVCSACALTPEGRRRVLDRPSECTMQLECRVCENRYENPEHPGSKYNLEAVAAALAEAQKTRPRGWCEGEPMAAESRKRDIQLLGVAYMGDADVDEEGNWRNVYPEGYRGEKRPRSMGLGWGTAPRAGASKVDS